MTCTFFGHRLIPKSVNQRLLQVIEELITKHGVHTFYVGQQGEFDKAVCAARRREQTVVA